MAVHLSESREHIAKFLDEHGIGVLATADKTGKPHAATVYFSHDDQLNLYFITKKETQKYRNIATNNQVAIAIFDPQSQTTVQLEGKAEEITNTASAERIFYEVWNTALKTSDSGVIPVSKLKAGGYVVCRVSAPSVRMASFDGRSTDNNIFEVAV